jgi:Zn-dependent protease
LDKFQVFLLIAPVILFSMVAHEYAHGYAALKQGDPTAYQLGRLTWNPLKHIDPVMTVLMPVATYLLAGFIFGGAKPVPVNPRLYRNFRRGDIIVSLAGIFVNLCLAVICTALIVVFGWLGTTAGSAATSFAILQVMMGYGVLFNLVLAFFNLLPIPPLDGSHVFKYVLPPAWALHYQRVGFLGIFLLVFLVRTSVLQSIIWTPVGFLVGGALDLTHASLLPLAAELLHGLSG